MEYEINIGHEVFVLRMLERDDDQALGSFFAGLSAETRSRFGPHPLDEVFAIGLCRDLEADTADRFVLTTGGEIVGYFIIDRKVNGEEADRYRRNDIELLQGKDCMFAPCLADAYQDKGLGGMLMTQLIDHCRARGYRSLVLLGGTQASNARALRFYRKCGFKECGSFMTDVDNIDMQLEL